ncbi:hypothetical protein GCM10009799_32900 [Nocardiopsis rhodophaea]|uniref:Uncharacterized protein n=1 Tax=Nocardiopsis rhodophaea TaxID=280238 RepID=A0ABN2TA83_9ACTN
MDHGVVKTTRSAKVSCPLFHRPPARDVASTDPTELLSPTGDLIDHLATINDPRDVRGRRSSLPGPLALCV